MSTPMAISLDTYEDWSNAAETAVYELIAAGGTFSAEDLHRKVPADDLTPEQKSAWPGALFRRLSRAGVIEKANYGNSRARSRRGGARYEWQGVSR